MKKLINNYCFKMIWKWYCDTFFSTTVVLRTALFMLYAKSYLSRCKLLRWTERYKSHCEAAAKIHKTLNIIRNMLPSFTVYGSATGLEYCMVYFCLSTPFKNSSPRVTNWKLQEHLWKGNCIFSLFKAKLMTSWDLSLSVLQQSEASYVDHLLMQLILGLLRNKFRKTVSV